MLSVFSGDVDVAVGEMCRHYNNQVYCTRAQYKDLNPVTNPTHTMRCLTHTEQGLGQSPSQTLRGYCVPLKTHDNFCRFHIYYAKNKKLKFISFNFKKGTKEVYKLLANHLCFKRFIFFFIIIFFYQCMYALLYSTLSFDYFRKS